MKNFASQYFASLLMAASIFPVNAFEESVNRRLNVDYSVNETIINFTDPLIYSNGTIVATNHIGYSVGNQSVSAELLNYGCDHQINRTGLELELSNVTEYFIGGVYQWKMQVIPEKLNDSPGGMVNITHDLGQVSEGFIQFCTRVSTWLGALQVGFYEGNYKLKFDFSNNTFSLDAVGVDQDDQDNFVTDVENPFTLDACQCANFACVTTPANPVPIKQDSSLVICLTPSSLGDASVVKITNFNLRIVDSIGGAVTYDPVTFGGSSWAPNGITLVQEDPNSNTIMITAPIIAIFFTEGVQQIDALGNALLEFVGKQEVTTFNSYGLQFNLAAPEEEELGCLDRLFAMFF